MRIIFKFIAIILASLFSSSCKNDFTTTGVLNPKGVVASIEHTLLFDSLALMMIVVIPVIIMSIAFIIRYRASHKTAEYRPNWSHNYFIEAIWWGIPCAIIAVMAVMSWRATHALDPYHLIEDKPADIRIQVITLPWKFLFIYPEQKIATVNYLRLPKDKQVEFDLSSDNAAMAAFFIPQLGSQIYTMAGMKTKLHLIPTSVGRYRGMNSQYNGDGFSENHFEVDVVDAEAMDAWYKEVKKSTNKLSNKEYQLLRKPSIADPVKYYSTVVNNLYDTVVMSYMDPKHMQHQSPSTTKPTE
jgi:cytochrome o ubiquinol oxidase subunit 2